MKRMSEELANEFVGDFLNQVYDGAIEWVDSLSWEWQADTNESEPVITVGEHRYWINASAIQNALNVMLTDAEPFDDRSLGIVRAVKDNDPNYATFDSSSSYLVQLYVFGEERF